MSKRDGKQKGAQQHPQGGHGERTHRAIVEQLQSNNHNATDDANPLENRVGKHPIYEDREEHDEADKNADKNRLRHDRSKGRA